MKDRQTGLIKVKLYLLQILYWMAFCAISGFATVFLLDHQLGSREIGAIIAIGSLCSVVIQFFTSSFISYFSGLTVRRLMALFYLMGAVASVGVLLWQGQPLLLAIIYCGVIVILFNTQPLVTTLIYEYINQGVPVVFASTRGIGSLTYAVTSFSLGLILERVSTISLPILFLISLVLLALLTLSLPEVETSSTAAVQSEQKGTSLAEFTKKYPRFFLFVLGIVLIFSFHTLTNVYLPQMVNAVGGGSKELGYAIALAGICELPTMFAFNKLAARFNVVRLLRFSAVFFLLKALIYLWAANFLGLQLSQTLQMFSFALITPAYAYYVNEWLEPADQISGQTFIMAGVTLGNVIGSLSGGFILAHGTVQQMLTFGVILTVVGVAVCWQSLRGKENIGLSNSN